MSLLKCFSILNVFGKHSGSPLLLLLNKMRRQVVTLNPVYNNNDDTLCWALLCAGEVHNNDKPGTALLSLKQYWTRVDNCDSALMELSFCRKQRVPFSTKRGKPCSMLGCRSLISPLYLYFAAFGRYFWRFPSIEWLNGHLASFGQCSKKGFIHSRKQSFGSGHFINDVQQVPATTSPTDPCQPHYILRGGKINYLWARSSENTLTYHCRVCR